MQQFKIIAPLYRNFFQFYIAALGLLSISRICLVIWQHQRIGSASDVMQILEQGVRFDIISISIIMLFPLLLISLLSFSHKLTNKLTIFNRFYLAFAFGVLIIIEGITPDFIVQFELRPNVWFVEYIHYPQEVASMLLTGFLLSSFLASTATIGGAILLFRKMQVVKRKQSSHPLFSLIATFVVLLAMVLSIRSTLGHRPITPSAAAFSQDKVLNSLGLNSFYSAIYAGYRLASESSKSVIYIKSDVYEMIADTKNFMNIPDNQFLSDSKITLHQNYSDEHKSSVKPKNLVIILQESLGAEYVTSLGGIGVTPNIERLKDEGWWFEKLYATGTRSARGIEAVLTGFLPTRAQSIIKRSKSKNNFFTIASALKAEGYSTDFIYGGDSRFDNMRSFFLLNGFEDIFDQFDFKNPSFETSWGVSDEELFIEVDKRLSQKSKDKPFFSLVFSTSNHPPYDYPDGTIEAYKGEKQSPPSAVKYADYALGKYIEKAKLSNYWQDTVFLIVADHASNFKVDPNAKKQLMPIKRFQVPAIILGAGIKPKKINRVVSHVDLMPTMLSLIGVNTKTPMVGLDLTRGDLEGIPQRTIMQYADIQAYREDDRLIIFQPNREPQQFDINADQLTESEAIDKELVRRAISISNLPTYLYENGLYRLE